MDLLSKVACYFRWTRCPRDPPLSPQQQISDLIEREGPNVSSSTDDLPDLPAGNFNDSSSLCRIVENIVFWENPARTIAVIVVFNLLFWTIRELEVHGITAACSAALVVIFSYKYLESQIQKEDKSSHPARCHLRTGQIQNIEKCIASSFKSLQQLRQEQPGIFCTAICSLSFALWIIGRTINGVLIAYTICMAVLLGPILLLKLPNKITTQKEWDHEIEEFLPAVTEDSLQVLRRAGDTGDQSSTPTSVTSEAQNEFFDDELMGLKMPSHDDGSTDGVELSELELSTGDTDVDGIKFQSEHFEKGSSSEEEAELRPEAKKLLNHNHESDDSYSDFEIIDTQEVANLGDI